ncbi:TRAP-type C4-dicarboxylate transport system, small permease component [Paramicrobacterium humi]|uniref:TRAP-type C4-dicarboxylate transport system, small permease component n=1 Tax=Paramicrobacterium humi TaxID=640635 RepID=A0A1H4KVI4_9MICO|nr:TRAP transporter small permease [Microbacterium humi]SEB62521.1 TRAP-type C4-dicarboxylate transport system, small permease component [Microbacterium humi]
MPRPIERILSALDTIVQWLCVLALAAVTFAVSWQVITRYVTRDSASWTLEVAALAFVWLSMMAIALGVRQGRHMVLDIWEYVPERRWLRITITTVSSALVLATLVALTWFGVEALPSAMRRNMPGIDLPFGLVSLAVPVGSAIAAIFTIEAWWRLVRNPDPDADPLPSAVLFQSGEDTMVKGEI